MKRIYYSQNGEAVSDYNIATFVDDIFKSDKEEFHISTAMIIDELRARVYEKRLDLNSFTVIVEGDEFIIDKNGRSRNWSNCLEVGMNIIDRLL